MDDKYISLLTPIDELLKACDYITDPDHIALIRKAYTIGAKAHSTQLRKSGDPYFNHCIATAMNIADLNMDFETICAGLLHDTLEDTDYKDVEMREDFGETITKLVEGVTKLGKVKYSGAERHVESLRKFFIAMSDDIRVVVVKLCDRLHNISTLEHVKPEKQKRIALETIEIHARLADRLGMGRLKAKLEDLSFPFAYPDEYKKVKDILETSKANNEDALKSVVNNLSNELKILDVNIERVDHRVKHLYSLWLKLKKNNYDISKIYDVIAIRVIVPTIGDCYQSLGVIHGLYKPVQGRFKDYIAVPKPNGYKSLHTAIFSGTGEIVEIQIRTRDMHEEAEYGIASHGAYKESKYLKNTDQNLRWTRDLLEWQKDVNKSEEYIKHLKDDFFNERIFVFTPKGEVIDLPIGATPLDFAYQIHTDVGDHASRSYVNDKLVSFDFTLKNNDMVKIETSDKSTPNRKWLNMCKSQLTKKHIRLWLKNNGGLIDKLFIK